MKSITHELTSIFSDQMINSIYEKAYVKRSQINEYKQIYGLRKPQYKKKPLEYNILQMRKELGIDKDLYFVRNISLIGRSID